METGNINIYGKLVAQTGEGKVADTDQIFDKTLGKFQSEINGERENYYTKDEIDNMVEAIKQFNIQIANTLPEASESTMFTIYLIPSSNPKTTNSKDEYITIKSGNAYSWEQVGSTEIDLSGYSTTEEMNAAILSGLNNLSFSTGEKVANLGVDEEPTAGSENLVKSGGVQNELALGAVYDVSAKNPTAGSNNDGKFESLSALLSDANINTLIPIAVRKGGMSIKFVQSSDNKYVQYRLGADGWSVNTFDWSFCGNDVYVRHPEFVYVKTDKDNRILWAIKTDGTVFFGAGVPPQVVDYIQLKIDEYHDDDREYLDNTYGKYIENPEWIKILTDVQNRIIAGVRKNGSVVFPGGIEGLELDGYATEEYVDEKDALLQEEIDNIQPVINNTYNTFNEYSQALTVNATPSITTDTNNYLSSTGDTTDRTADILAMLQTTKVCHLGAGRFYIDGLVMPDNTSLIGCGSATEVVLKDGNNKFAIKMGNYNTIRDFTLLGSTGSVTPSSTVGTRHGILWQGNYTAVQEEQATANLPSMGIISNMMIARFNGGGITCYDTGYGVWNCVEVNNCHIYYCDAGINISYWSEFHKFTNVKCIRCYYGCINNGGNNVFVNCDFSASSGIAFLIDNAQGQSPNNAHGSCIGCVFNHTADNQGIGIKILNSSPGFIFDGCQIFFSQIQIEDSKGVVFSNCNIGYSNCDIIISRGDVIIFIGNMIGNAIPVTITNNDKVHFINCYNKTTGEIFI